VDVAVVGVVVADAVEAVDDAAAAAASDAVVVVVD